MAQGVCRGKASRPVRTKPQAIEVGETKTPGRIMIWAMSYAKDSRGRRRLWHPISGVRRFEADTGGVRSCLVDERLRVCPLGPASRDLSRSTRFDHRLLAVASFWIVVMRLSFKDLTELLAMILFGIFAAGTEKFRTGS